MHVLDNGSCGLFMGLGSGASLVAPAFDEPGQASHFVSKLEELHVLSVSLEHISQDLDDTSCLPALLEGLVPVHVHHHCIWSGALGCCGGLALGS